MRKLLVAAVAVVALGGAAAAGAVLFAPLIGTAQEAPVATTPPATPAAPGTPEAPEYGGRRGGRLFHLFGPEGRLDVAAKAIGISAAKLGEQLAAGKTVAEVAKANNVDPQTVIDALVKDTNAQLEAAVQAKRLTQAQADAIKQGAPERIARFVNEGFKDRHGCMHDDDDSGTPAPGQSGTPAPPAPPAPAAPSGTPAQTQSQFQGV